MFILLLVGALASNGQAAGTKSKTQAKPASRSPSPTPNSSAKDPTLERVKSAIAAAKGSKAKEKRLKVVKDLETYLSAANEAKPEPLVSAIRYQVALEPLFEKKSEIGSAEACKNIRDEMIFKFASGSGFGGVLPDFVLESLKVLAAACQDESLAKAPEWPENHLDLSK